VSSTGKTKNSNVKASNSRSYNVLPVFGFLKKHSMSITLAFGILAIIIVTVQVEFRWSLVFRTDAVSSIPAILARIIFGFPTSVVLQKEIPTKKANQLKNFAGFLQHNSSAGSEFNTCDRLVSDPETIFSATQTQGMQVGSEEWVEWVQSAGTSNANFRVQVVPESQTEQEFPVYHSPTPCGIHSVQSVHVDPFGVVAEQISGNAGVGSALVVEMETEVNLDHTLRAGVAICSFLWKRQIEKANLPRPIHFVVFWNKEDELDLDPDLKKMKLEMMSAFGEVIFYSHEEAAAEQQARKTYFQKVYAAPWNEMPSRCHDYALANGLIQHQVGETSLRLAMSKVVVNRKPLRMYQGFAEAFRSGLDITTRKRHEGGVVVIQRGVYPDPRSPPESYRRHLAGERGKRRLLVDAKTGLEKPLMQRLCQTELKIKVLDFHPKAKKKYSFKEQLKIMAGTAVLAASHGSGLSNALWMRPGSVAIEVTLRAGYCCMPIPKENYENPHSPCTRSCAAYTMVNIADGILASGVKWFYLDPIIIDQPTGNSNRDTRRVHVDSDLFAKVIQGAYVVATGTKTTAADLNI